MVEYIFIDKGIPGLGCMNDKNFKIIIKKKRNYCCIICF